MSLPNLTGFDVLSWLSDTEYDPDVAEHDDEQGH